jgi:hypothetical protein
MAAWHGIMCIRFIVGPPVSKGLYLYIGHWVGASKGKPWCSMPPFWEVEI